MRFLQIIGANMPLPRKSGFSRDPRRNSTFTPGTYKQQPKKPATPPVSTSDSNGKDYGFLVATLSAQNKTLIKYQEDLIREIRTQNEMLNAMFEDFSNQLNATNDLKSEVVSIKGSLEKLMNTLVDMDKEDRG